MWNSIVTSGCLLGSKEVLDEFGIDQTLILEAAGLSPYVLEHPNRYIEADRVFNYLELAAKACQRADFGLLHAENLPVGVLGQIWLSLRRSQTIGDLVYGWMDSYTSLTDVACLSLETTWEGKWLVYSVVPNSYLGISQAVNLTFGMIVSNIREQFRTSWHPKRIRLMQTPENPENFLDFFGCEIEFGYPQNAILMQERDLQRSVKVHRSKPYAYREAKFDHRLQPRISQNVVVAQVKSGLHALLQFEECSLDLIAEAIGVSRRTLQRRLNEAGTSYCDLVEESRAELSWHLVTTTSLYQHEIAGILGYNSPSAFSRAFQRWHNTTPRAARKRNGTRS